MSKLTAVGASAGELRIFVRCMHEIKELSK